jgi:alpha-tubulin suppressor-like RCC1 family protein
MPEPPANKPEGKQPSEEDVDGVVLFDPAAYEGPDLPPARSPGRRRAVAFLIWIPLLAAAGYGAYATRDMWLPQEEVAPVVPPVVDTEVTPREPRLETLSRVELSGSVDSSVVLAVRAMGATAPLADTSVLFEVTEGGGDLSLESARTDARGIARTELSLPSQVGTVTVTARLAESELWTAFTVGVLPGAATRIASIRGDRQVAQIQEMLTNQVAIVVTDEAGNPVPGVEVRFSVASGMGMVAPDRTRSNAEGLARAFWRLGSEPGTHRLVAAVEGLDTTVTFTATARARPVVTEAGPQPVETLPVTVVRRDFVIGNSHVCALVGGAVTCRGASVRGQSGATSSGLVALATGTSHMCGLNPIGDAACWGANDGGQLGDGTRTDRESPVQVRTELHFSTLTAGATHTCGLAGGGVPICWGQNLNGQIGDGSRIDRLAPTTVGGGLRFTSLVAGWNHTCGLTDNGNAWCWGLNSEGQLGDGSRLDRLTPTLVRASLQSLAAGSAHTCGIGGGQVMCWGDNRFGQLGDGSTEARAQPVAVDGLPGSATGIAAGAVHTCALLADGSAYCWGQNLQGQLGDGSTQSKSRATAVAGGIRFRSIYAGGALTCGFSTDGSQYCWGLNQSGQLGDGTRESRSTPTRIG